MSSSVRFLRNTRHLLSLPLRLGHVLLMLLMLCLLLKIHDSVVSVKEEQQTVYNSKHIPMSHLHANVKIQEAPRVVMTLLTINYCTPATVLWKSLRVVAPTVTFVLLVPEREDISALYSNTDCSLFIHYDPNVEIIRIGQEAIPSTARIGLSSWAVSMDKMVSFGFSNFSRIMLVDADTLILASPDDWFDLLDGEVDFAGVVDQFDGCNRREVINNGITVFRPSHQLLSMFRTTLMDDASCLSGKWQWSDQEVTNCLCGLAGTKNPEQRRHDLRCRVLPYSYGAIPHVSSCREYLPEDVKAIHFAGDRKPWKANIEEPFFELWRCYKQNSIADIPAKCHLASL